MKPTVPEYETLVGDVLDLRAFALTTDLRSFTAAAELMGESKATLSRRVARLEAALGVPLLLRTPRSVEPTEDGVAYRARVAEILELLGSANAAARNAFAEPSGQLRITVPPGFDAHLAPLMARFARSHPRVTVSALVTERFVDLDAEHIDLALRATRKLADSALVAHRLFAMDLLCVASPAYLREAGTPRRVEQLLSHRVIRLGRSSVNSKTALQRVGDEKDTLELRLPYSIGATDAGFAKSLAVAGAGVALLPREVVAPELEAGRLEHILRGYVSPGSSLYLLHRGGAQLTPKVRAFRDFVIEGCPSQRKPDRTR